MPEQNDPKAAYDSQIQRLFATGVVASIAITLTLGTLWGVIGLTQIASNQSYQAPNYASTQAHGHAQMFGWIGLLIMGVAYAMAPRFCSTRLASPPLALANLGLMLFGLVLRAVAQPRAEGSNWGWAVVLSSAVELVAVGIFVGLLTKALRFGWRNLRTTDIWIAASLFWLAVVALLQLPLSIWMASRQLGVVPEPANGILMNLTLYGFIASMIFGMGYRLLPGLLWLEQPRAQAGRVAFWLFSLATLMKLAHPPVPASSLGHLAAAAILTWSLRVYERPRPAPAWRYGDVSVLWFVRLAFFWLLAASAMAAGADVYRMTTGNAAPHEFMGAYRHAVTVGFISTLAVGVASRIVPVFGHRQLHSVRMLRWTFWLLAVGNTLRVLFQIATLTGSPWFFAVAGMSGYLELTALTIFSVNIIATLRRDPEKPEAVIPVTTLGTGKPAA